MSEPTVTDATNSIYASLQADNADIDGHIATLKAALTRAGLREAVFDPTRLVQNNRSGRKLMQAYFRQRGVTVKYSAIDEANQAARRCLPNGTKSTQNGN